MEQDNTLDLGQVTDPTEATDEFIEITFPDRKDAAPAPKRRRLWPILSIAAVLLSAVGLCLFLYSSQGQSTPEAVAQAYAAAQAKAHVGPIYRLFPAALQHRFRGWRADLLEEMDEFYYAYGQDTAASLVSVEDYSQADRLSMSALLEVEISNYKQVVLQKELDGRLRNIHLDVIEIQNKWYLTEVWNDDIVPGIGFDDPAQAVDAYLTAFASGDYAGMASALSPALAHIAIEKGYGLRDMIYELDDFVSNEQSGQPVSYSLLQTKDYSAYQTQNITEILGIQPQAYCAYHLEALIGDTLYTVVFDLVQADDRWGITAVWDYNKSYIL